MNQLPEDVCRVWVLQCLDEFLACFLVACLFIVALDDWSEDLTEDLLVRPCLFALGFDLLVDAIATTPYERHSTEFAQGYRDRSARRNVLLRLALTRLTDPTDWSPFDKRTRRRFRHKREERVPSPLLALSGLNLLRLTVLPKRVTQSRSGSCGWRSALPASFHALPPNRRGWCRTRRRTGCPFHRSCTRSSDDATGGSRMPRPVCARL